MEKLVKMFPSVEKCCCCCSIEAGTQVIGWLSLCLNTVQLIYTSVCLGLYAGDLNEHLSKRFMITLMVVCAAFLIMKLVYIMLACILLKGVYMNQLEKVWLWLKVSVVLFILLVVLDLFGVIIIITSKYAAAILINSLLEIVVSFYILAVVKSYYYSKQVVLKQEMP